MLKFKTEFKVPRTDAREVSTSASTITGETTLFPVKNILFTQNTVAGHFDNGQTLAFVTQELIREAITPDAFPPLRIVKHVGQWWSLDNRRLRVFKDALVIEVPVIVCSLGDAPIKREYFDKKTNRSLDQGGSIRPMPVTRMVAAGANDGSHFEEGVFVFTKKVLNWNLEQLDNPLPQLASCVALPSVFSSRQQYFQQFLPLILEDARASLKSQLDACVQSGMKPEKLTLKRIKLSTTFENPSTMLLQKDISSTLHIQSGDVIFLRPANYPDLKCLAIATYKKEGVESQNNLQVKIVLDQVSRLTYPLSLEAGSEWQALSLGSIITHMRMYDVCLAMPQAQFERQLLTPNFGMATAFGDMSLNDNVSRPDLMRLNPSQQNAVVSFLRRTEGIEMIEGPPGTGKTTTLLALLKVLIARGERVLVSAPSNQAVQVIAKQFMQENPDACAILVGVEEKLPDDPVLQKIFIHTWGDQITDNINALSNEIWDLLPERLDEQALPEAVVKLKDIEERYLAFIELVKRYGFEQFTVNQPSFMKAIESYRTLLTSLRRLKNEGRETLAQLASILNQLIAQIKLQQLDDSKAGLEAGLLNGAKIVFATLSVVGRKPFKETRPVDTVVVDEAAQSIEAEVLITLTVKPRKLLLTGDTNQLPATVLSIPAKKLGYDRSLMWRLIKECAQPYSLLVVQHRMHPLIRQWPSQRYYRDAIEDHDSIKRGDRDVSCLRSINFLHPYAFINVSGEEEKKHYSFVNIHEINLIKMILQYLSQVKEIDVTRRVGIITFYKKQVDELNIVLQRIYPGINVRTVDGFQGGECDFVIVSFVRSNVHSNIGFLEDFRRLNVAVTRARNSLIMVGNAQTLTNGSADLRNLIENVGAMRLLFQADNVLASMQSEIKEIEERRQTERASANPLFKTQLCTIFSRRGSCVRGDRCNFAHGTSELRKRSGSRLRPSDAAVPSFKQYTRVCIYYTGTPNSCKKGDQCEFKHILK